MRDARPGTTRSRSRGSGARTTRADMAATKRVKPVTIAAESRGHAGAAEILRQRSPAPSISGRRLARNVLDVTTGIPSLVDALTHRPKHFNLEEQVRPENVLPLIAGLGHGRPGRGRVYGPKEKYGKNRIGHAAAAVDHALIGTSDGGHGYPRPWWAVPAVAGVVTGKPDFLFGHAGHGTQPGSYYTKRQASNQQRKVLRAWSEFIVTVNEMVRSGEMSEAEGRQARQWGNRMEASASPTANLRMGIDHLNSRRP